MVPSLSIRRSRAQTRTDLVRNVFQSLHLMGSQLDCLSSKPPQSQDHRETCPGPESTECSLQHMTIKEIIIRVVILLIFECFIWGSLEIGLKMDERENVPS